MRILNNYFIYNGINSADYGIRITGQAFGAPERDETAVSIPGKNGDVILDNGRWKNRTHVYECSITKDFEHNFNSFRQAIMASHGYHRLEDTYHPEEFYTARLSGAIEPTTNNQLGAGSFTLTFDRKPQRFLKSGEHEIERINYTPNSFEIYNPTKYESRPLFKVNCGSTDTLVYLKVGDGGTGPKTNTTVFMVYDLLEEAFEDDQDAWTAALAEGLWVYYDTEIGEAYSIYTISGAETRINLNAGIQIAPSGKMPSLPGEEETYIGTTAYGGKFTVTPRWYTI